VQPGAGEHFDGVIDIGPDLRNRFVARASAQEPVVDAEIQQLDALPNVLQRIDHAQERGNGDDLRGVELDAGAFRIERRQRLARRRFIERVAVV